MRIRLVATTLLLACSLPLLAQTNPPTAPVAEPAPSRATAAPANDAGSGKLAYYGKRFAGHKTASGERFRPEALTMAHKTLPFGTLVRVTNPANKRSVVVRVNDRGPTQGDRVGDVSLAAARALRMQHAGVIDAQLAVVGTAKHRRRG